MVRVTFNVGPGQIIPEKGRELVKRNIIGNNLHLSSEHAEGVTKKWRNITSE